MRMKGRLKFRKWEGFIKVFNKQGEKLGFISRNKEWKCWVWEQELAVIMSAGCLEEIVNYMRRKEAQNAPKER